jgi:DNA (cytosine-5)-methyltransferase 1
MGGINVDTTEELPTVISFCSGYGGIERGLDLAGVEHRVIAYVEIEAFAIANLVNKMEDGIIPPAPIYTDIKTFPAHLFRGKVSILTGGYPCQPFSAAGKRLGEDDPRHLWPHIRKHIEAIRPARCFFENVEGHISLGLSSVISDLEEDGYRSAWGIFSAREVGAPHQRKRVYIMADSNSVRCDGRKLPNRTGQRPVEIEAQQRPEQPVVRSEAEGCGGDSGDFSNTRNNRVSIRHVEPSEQGQQRQTNNAYTSCPTLSDTISERLEGHTGHGEDCNQSRWVGEKKKRPVSKGSLCNREPNLWAPEPRLGRVVNGCPDRVDRIRLLGNGVVPQTAAKAYTTLSERLI